MFETNVDDFHKEQEAAKRATGVNYRDALELAIAALQRAGEAKSESAVLNHIDSALLEVGVGVHLMHTIPRQLSPFRTKSVMQLLGRMGVEK